MEHTISPAGRCRSSGRTRSLSSFSSSSSRSLDDDSSPLGPATPLRLISRVPFSWEKFPGIPKNNQDSKKGSDHSLLLPLPPTSKRPAFQSNQSKVKVKHRVSVDPFFAALVECSKDRDDQQEASRRSLVDRFSLASLCASCKRTCAVSESLVYLPRSPAASLKYDLIDRRHNHQKYYKSIRF